MSRSFLRRGLRPALMLSACLPTAASAHIKWFADVDVTGDPRVPWEVFAQPSFAALSVLALLALFAAGAVDARLSSARPFDAGERAFAALRWGLAACLVATALYFQGAPVFLTPELRTGTPWIPALQLAIALAAVLDAPRAAAAGLVVLFVGATARYGAFHLLDYPLYLGIATCLATRGRAAGTLRAAVALTFLWGGIEKWLYPQWTFPLLCGSAKPLRMGLSPDVFMQGAGFVEFGLAFVVLAGGLAARVAALALVGVFLAAIPMFGAIDAVGHAPFMLALLVLAARPNPLARHFARPTPAAQGARWAGAFAALLCGLPLAYRAAHQAAYGRLRLEPVSVTMGAAATVLALGLLLRTGHRAGAARRRRD